MSRRTALSAALAALTVPALLVLAPGPAYADDGGPLDLDPSAQTQQRKADGVAAPRTSPPVSRKAKRAAARAETDSPLAVSIDQLTSTIPERGMVRISGTVTNNDDVTWVNVNTYAFISDTPLTSSAQLAAAAETPADTVVGERLAEDSYRYTIPELVPGDSKPFSFSLPRRELVDSNGVALSKPGVYWFGVHALGESPDGRDQVADGKARTFLPLVPPNRTGQLPTSIVVPLRQQLVFSEDGSLDNLAAWTRTLSDGGRLRSLVEFGASSGADSLTWVIDPALLDGVRRLAEGNPPRSLEPNLQQGEEDGEPEGDPSAPADGSTGPETEAPPGEPAPTEAPDQEDDANPLDLDELDPVAQAATAAAQAWLARLGDAVRPEDQVLTLPYGDVDVAGAARHDPQLLQRAVARSGAALPGLDVTPAPVVSSPSGFLSLEGLRATDPTSTVLVNDAMLGTPAPASATVEGHRVVVTSTGAAAGGPGPDERTAMTAMRQRLLAEAAVRFLRNPRTPLTVMLPHDWKPSAAGSFFAGLDVPWLGLTTVSGIKAAAGSDPVAPETVRYPSWQERSELDDSSFESAEELAASGAALQSMLTLNNLVSGTVGDQALASASYGARSRPLSNRDSTDRSREWIEDRLGDVQVAAPSAVILSSSSGRFAATVTNRLDQPVTVALDARSDDELTIAGPRTFEVAANGRRTVLLTARTDENGIHEVRLLVTDKRGVPLGASTSLSVRSAQVSNVIWLFLAIGAGLLFGAIALRLFRRVRNARRTPPEVSGDEPGDATGEATGDAEPGDADKAPAGVAR